MNEKENGLHVRVESGASVDKTPTSSSICVSWYFFQALLSFFFYQTVRGNEL